MIAGTSSLTGSSCSAFPVSHNHAAKRSRAIEPGFGEVGFDASVTGACFLFGSRLGFTSGGAGALADGFTGGGELVAELSVVTRPEGGALS